MKYFVLFLFLLSCSTHHKTVVAHRGASGYLPEHTHEAVVLAHSWGVDFIEPDVVLTKDNHAVIMHNIFLDMTTNVADIFPQRKRKDGRYYVVDFNLSEIRKLSANDSIDPKSKKLSYPPRFPFKKARFQVPTLEEYIQLVQGLNKTRSRNIGIYPELKAPEFYQKEGKDIARLVLPILEKYGYNREDANIYLQCFHIPTLKRMREELGAKMPMVALLAENSWGESSLDYEYYKSEAGVKEIAQFAQGLGPWFGQLVKPGTLKSSGLVELAHRYGLKVHPYTHRSDKLPPSFDSDKDFFDFLYNHLGADGVFSDFGDRALLYSR